MNRRRFLWLAGAPLVAACNAQGKEALPLLRFAERQNEKLERRLFSPTALDTPKENATSAGDAFPRYFISKQMPVWDEQSRGPWRLEITGAVTRPLSLSLDELMALPKVTHRVNHYCVEGWTAVVQWTGVQLSELARLAGVLPDAGYVDFESFDSGYHESWDLESALHPQTLVAYGKDGSPLGPDYGAPARVHSPVKLGYKNTKYLTRIVFSPYKTGGYWSDQGYEWFAGV